MFFINKKKIFFLCSIIFYCNFSCIFKEITDYIPTESIEKIFNIINIHKDYFFEREFCNIEKLNEWLQKNFLRQKNKERWEIEKNKDIFNDFSQDVYIQLNKEFENIFKKYNYENNENSNFINTSEVCMIFGKTMKNFFKECIMLKNIIEKYPCIKNKSFFVIGGYRELDKSIGETVEILNKLFISFNYEILNDEEIIEFEKHNSENIMMKIIFNKIFKNNFHHIEFYFESKEDVIKNNQKRSTTLSTLKNFLYNNDTVEKYSNIIGISSFNYALYFQVMIDTSFKELENKIKMFNFDYFLEKNENELINSVFNNRSSDNELIQNKVFVYCDMFARIVYAIKNQF